MTSCKNKLLTVRINSNELRKFKHKCLLNRQTVSRRIRDFITKELK